MNPCKYNENVKRGICNLGPKGQICWRALGLLCAGYFTGKGEKYPLLLCLAQEMDQYYKGRLQTEECKIHFKQDIWTGQNKGLQGLKPYLTSKKKRPILEVRKHRELVRTANCQPELSLLKEIKIKTRQVFSWRRNRRERTWRSKIWHQNWLNALPWDAVLWDRVRWLERLLISTSKQRLCCAFPSPHHGDEASPHVLHQFLNPLVNQPRKACG